MDARRPAPPAAPRSPEAEPDSRRSFDEGAVYTRMRQGATSLVLRLGGSAEFGDADEPPGSVCKLGLRVTGSPRTHTSSKTVPLRRGAVRAPRRFLRTPTDRPGIIPLPEILPIPAPKCAPAGEAEAGPAYAAAQIPRASLTANEALALTRSSPLVPWSLRRTQDGSRPPRPSVPRAVPAPPPWGGPAPRDRRR